MDKKVPNSKLTVKGKVLYISIDVHRLSWQITTHLQTLKLLWLLRLQNRITLKLKALLNQL